MSKFLKGLAIALLVISALGLVPYILIAPSNKDFPSILSYVYDGLLSFGVVYGFGMILDYLERIHNTMLERARVTTTAPSSTTATNSAKEEKYVKCRACGKVQTSDHTYCINCGDTLH